ncbi:MAG: 50S rRNA methyltransferase [Thiotrichales bacterium SG8_50]|nr:MAG: 50S rRNA methyltransferase [Thiotrichales bacterium SG8_50]
MKLHILSVGHKPPAWIAEGVQEYARRMPRELPVVLTAIRPAGRAGKAAEPAARTRAAERDRILAAIPSSSVKVALDEHGKTLTTVQLASQLQNWMAEGRDVCFVIGGADGLDEGVKESADLVFSLSRLTMPHALARVVLVEQLYRAASIMRNHPYHRE